MEEVKIEYTSFYVSSSYDYLQDELDYFISMIKLMGYSYEVLGGVFAGLISIFSFKYNDHLKQGDIWFYYNENKILNKIRIDGFCNPDRIEFEEYQFNKVPEALRGILLDI